MNYRIDKLVPLYPEATSDNFAESIFKKEEFYSNRTPITAIPILKGSGERYPQQQFLANFLSPLTPYNKMLIYHAMGQGKTCASIAVSEINKNNLYSKPTLVLVRGGSGVQIFKKAIINDCSAPGLYDRSRISPSYEIKTLQKFVNSVRFPIDSEVYSDRVIIIDEAHNVRLQPETGVNKNEEEFASSRVEFAKIYNTIFRLLHTVKNVKIILLTGTPMRDVPSEIASLMNLILPIDFQLPTDEKFNERYIDSRLGTLKNAEELQSKFLGVVSYLERNVNPQIEIKEMGVNTSVFSEFKIYPSYMQDIQYNAYVDAYKKDSDKDDLTKVNYSAFFGRVNQSVLCVTPSGGYTKNDYAGILKINKLSGVATPVGRVLKDFLTEVGDDDESKLKQLNKISCKYATIIRTILGLNENVAPIHDPDSEMKELVFVFNNLVSQSGGILFGFILNLFDFKRINVTRRREPTDESFSGTFSYTGHENYRSYAIINKVSTPSDDKVSAIIDAHNHPENVGGKYIRVVIGSEVIAEGIDLNNVSQIHIATPHWNNSETEQAIARGIRIGKHRDLINLNVKPIVRIFRHMAVREGGIPTVDYSKYDKSTVKAKLVKQVSNLMRDVSVDCNLNKPRNSVMGGQRLCMSYDFTQDPSYTGDIENPLSLQDLNKDTAIFFYSMNDRKSRIMMSIIKEMFKYKFRYYRIVIIDYVRKIDSSYTNDFITFVLKEMIDTLEPITNPYSKISYLKENANTYYLTNDPGESDISPDSIYYIYNTFDNTRLTDLKFTYDYLTRFVAKIDIQANVENVNIFDTLVLSNKILEIYSKQNIESEEEKQLLDNYRHLFITLDDNTRVFILPYLAKLQKVYVQLINEQWVLNENDRYQQVKDFITNKSTELSDNYNYYALVTVNNNKPDFKLAINTDFMVQKPVIKEQFQKKKCTTTNRSNVIKVYMDMKDITIASHNREKVVFNNGITVDEYGFTSGKNVLSILNERKKMTSRLRKMAIVEQIYNGQPDFDNWDDQAILKLFVGISFKKIEIICEIVKQTLFDNNLIAFAESSKSNRKKDK